MAASLRNISVIHTFCFRTDIHQPDFNGGDLCSAQNTGFRLTVICGNIHRIRIDQVFSALIDFQQICPDIGILHKGAEFRVRHSHSRICNQRCQRDIHGGSGTDLRQRAALLLV